MKASGTKMNGFEFNRIKEAIRTIPFTKLLTAAFTEGPDLRRLEDVLQLNTAVARRVLLRRGERGGHVARRGPLRLDLVLEQEELLPRVPVHLYPVCISSHVAAATRVSFQRLYTHDGDLP